MMDRLIYKQFKKRHEKNILSGYYMSSATPSYLFDESFITFELEYCINNTLDLIDNFEVIVMEEELKFMDFNLLMEMKDGRFNS